MYKVNGNFSKPIYELNGKFYKLPFRWLKLYEGDALARHFQACVNENGQVGYYEHVLGNFFPQPEEERKEVKIKNIYNEYQYKDGVTYLDCNTQYIDTGIDPRQISLYDEIMNKNDFIGKSNIQKTQ